MSDISLVLTHYSTDNENVYEAGSAATGQALPTEADYPTPANPVFGYRAPTGGSINNYGLMSNWSTLC